jgi:restriction endonuclease
LVVTSLVASVIFINLATTQANWRMGYEQKNVNLGNLQADYAATMSEKAILAEQVAKLNQGQTETEKQLRMSLDACKRENSQLTLANTQLETQLTNISTQIATLAKTYDGTLDHNKQLTSNLTAAWEKLNEKQEQVATMSDALKEEQARATRLAANLQVSSQTVMELKRMIAQLNDKLATVEATTPTTEDDQIVVADRQIMGTVTAVSDNLASINVGTAHGVKQGMKLIVYRGDQFVGTLKVEEVRPNEAAGILMNQRLAPMQGDRVTSNLN